MTQLAQGERERARARRSSRVAAIVAVLAVVSFAPATYAQSAGPPSAGSQRAGPDSAARAATATGAAATPSATAPGTIVLASGTRQPNASVLSLAEAVRIALSKSEAVRIAQAGVLRARGEVYEALSNWFPQLSGTAGYTRTLQTQYTALAKATAPPIDTSRTSQVALCSPRIDSLSTQVQRQAALNAALSCPNNNGFGGINFANVGFGSLNQYTLGLNFSQTLFNGQVLAQSQAVKSPRRAAEIEVTAQRAQVTFDVTQAYYDAALADRLVTIAESTLAQSDRTLQQTQLTKRVGTQSEFDLLQAQVTRNNQVPIVIQRRGERDIAYYRLKQLVKLPLDAPLQLTTDVEDSTAAPDGVHLASVQTVLDSGGVVMAAENIKLTADTGVDRRSTVREQVETVNENSALLRAAKSERLPAVVLTSQYQRVAYPLNLPSWADFLTNWNVGVGLSVPIFTGRRIQGDKMVAQANLDESRTRLQQTRELAVLDARTAIETLREAQAAWAASVGTVTQATRAYQIAELRYKEGISTQIELTDQRIAQQQALANRAQAARNLQVARVRLGLITDLPLSSAGAGASASQSAAQGNPTVAPPAATQQQTTTTAPGGPVIPGSPSTTAAPQTPTYPAASQTGAPAP
jgi:outer membrane protein